MLSMAVHRGLNLDLPESSSAQLSKDELLSISVKKSQTEKNGLVIDVNKKRVQLESLEEELKKMGLSEKNQQALIFAEESISYQELFQVLDQVKKGGIKAISLQANSSGE
jgi:biopolymer transport protein ExbD